MKRRGKLERPTPGEPPPSDYRFIDRLEYMLNGEGFTYDKVTHLWLVDVATGAATRLTDGPVPDTEPAWSPDGTRIAFASNRRRDHDLAFRQAIHVVDVRTRRVTAVTAGPRSIFGEPTWMPDGATIAALGNKLEGRGGSRNDIWLFPADGSEARAAAAETCPARHDLMPGSTMNSDVTVGEAPRLWPSPDGRRITFTAPIDGSYELWRIDTRDGDVERLTTDRHYISGWDAVAGPARSTRRASPTCARPRPRRPTCGCSTGRGSPAGSPRSTRTCSSELTLREPSERHSTVDGRDIQGWLLPAGKGARPLVTEIHGGPHTLYGWSPMWEFQILAANGMSVFYCNPRGSEGYGQDFNDANHRDWGPGPTPRRAGRRRGAGRRTASRTGAAGGDRRLVRRVPDELDRRPRRPIRGGDDLPLVSDMAMLFLTGDISGGDWAELEFDATPWSDPAYYREISPISYADRVTTPLLIQHSERDIRTTVGQAEALFTVLRSHRRPVRLLRVPGGDPRADALGGARSGGPRTSRSCSSWFRHYLVEGKRGLPPLPKVRAGR